MSDTCTAATPLSRDHLAPAIAAAGVTIAPAHHGAPSRSDERGTTTATADLLIVGRIATGDPAAPRAEAMAVRDGRILAVGSAADVDGLTGPRDEDPVSRRGGHPGPHRTACAHLGVAADARVDRRLARRLPALRRRRLGFDGRRAGDAGGSVRAREAVRSEH